VGSLDTQKILRYTAEIREAQKFLAEMTSEDIDRRSPNSMKMRAMKYTLIVHERGELGEDLLQHDEGTRC
jgi:hypothetical protein